MSLKLHLLIIGILVKLNSTANSPDQIVEKCFAGNSIISMTHSKKLAKALVTPGYGTVIEDQLLDEYPYQITHKGSAMLVNDRTRSCICRREHCILLCSPLVVEVYTKMVLQNRTNSDMAMFYITLTLANGLMVRRHLLRDFRAIVYHDFCDHSYSLSPEQDPNNSWALFENGTLLRHHDITYMTENEYCFDLDIIGDNLDNLDDLDYLDNLDELVINPVNCAIENNMSAMEVANNTSMVISIPFFVLTILAYCLLPQLLDINGKCFISYLSSITLSYSFLSFLNLSGLTIRSSPCIILGFINHYMQLAHYTWLGILSFDTWQSFSNLVHRPSFVGYASLGFITPFIWTLFTIWAEYSYLPEYLKPGITPLHCGLEVNKWAASIYLYAPCMLILLLCLYAFISTSKIIQDNEKVSKLYRTGFECPKICYALYLRLFIVMGLSWSLDVVSYVFSMLEMFNVSYVLDFINAVQGLFIFINFIGREKVRNIIKERWFTKHEPVLAVSYRPYSSSIY